jgi:transcription-repair coupling factor (superfamily II helicase)
LAPVAAIDAIARTQGRLVLANAPDGFDAAAFALAARLRGGVSLFVARDEARAASFEASARFFAPGLDLVRLPAWDSLPYDRISPTPSVAARRCAALIRLAARKEGEGALLVVTTASAIAQRLPPRAVLASAALTAKPGQVIAPAVLETYALVNGYGRSATVRAAGDFAMRGGVFDIFAPGMDEPLRFDFFGDTLESIRAFDPETQRSTRTLTSAQLTPVSEILFTDEAVSLFRKQFVQAFGAVSDPVYESVSARIRRQGVEQWLPLFYDRLETVFDYAGEGAMIGLEHLVDDARRDRMAQAQDHCDARRNAPPIRGAAPFRAPPPDALYLSESAYEAAIGARALRQFSPFAAPEGTVQTLPLGAQLGRNFAAERAGATLNVFEAATQHIAGEIKNGRRVLLAAWSEGSAERLGHVLEDHGLKEARFITHWSEAGDLPATKPMIAVLPLEHGFATDTIAVLSEQDLLGDRLARPRKRRRANSLIAEAAALAPGDLIVHSDHGIGRYEGLKTLDVQGAPHDCLDLSYSGGDKLYLPVENIELVSRYGSEDASAQLDKLGGVAWQSRKARAKQRLRDMAEELIRIAAARAARTAETVEAPEGLFDEFCARFPYEETEDQLSAIEDVIQDLAKGQPMDRLICGDVGFGKTEVALRAAFLVAMSGKQVAVVAPTTLLCRQHFRTFSERFQGLPVRVRQLSRLVGTKEANETRGLLADGKIEILVGTHAVLSQQVSFKDLGLLIVDEEQHFGVRHKERLKEMRADVHVLTLSATPIPRTLQLALSGIREMSIIATPPIDRLAVRTYVTPFDPVTVREALLRERYRGGQCFFVVPRIADLEEVEQFLREAAPELKFVTAHGQMAAGALDDIMSAFYEGEYDVLVSTTIVESGLDIPRANTLVVYRADMFGLAQLYQLRGRVGRSKMRAYAYLTTGVEKPLTAGAEKRLRILSSLDNLGAGFTLASHDLDMRGGGNLLGEEQSGHIKEVGVELYQSMLEDAVNAIKAGGEEDIADRNWSPQINVGAAVLIPEAYVPDLTVRLALYRRLGEINEDAEREAFAVEMADRFGPLPVEVEQLLSVAGLKAHCRMANVAKLDAGPKGAVLTFREPGFADPVGLVRLVQARPYDFKMRPDGKLVVQGEWPDPALRLKALRAAMESIVSLLKKAAA